MRDAGLSFCADPDVTDYLIPVSQEMYQESSDFGLVNGARFQKMKLLLNAVCIYSRRRSDKNEKYTEIAHIIRKYMHTPASKPVRESRQNAFKMDLSGTVPDPRKILQGIKADPGKV